MILEKLVNKSYMKIIGNPETEIFGLSSNSLNCKPGDIFFALEGVVSDGKKYAFEAIRNGSVAIVSRFPIENLPNNVCNVICKDERKAMSEISAKFFEYPSKELFIIGVTGTNGKTTITYMLESIFTHAGKKVGVIGTNGVRFCGKEFVTNMTTPDPILFQELLAKMRDDGVQIVCVEISAHALELQKNWGIMLDIALFSNLSQDHLDFFENMEKYYKAKAKMFSVESAIIGAVNVDDESGRRLYCESKIPMLSYSSMKKQATVCASEIIDGCDFQSFRVDVFGETAIAKIKLHGKHNVANALASICAGVIYGLNLETILQGLEKLQEVEGRFNVYDVDGIKVIVDFAHTPDGLENILKTAKEMTNGKLISVFGCGGNRDKLKRPIMGQISEHYATHTIITSDNPRFEDPLEIAKEIESGMKDQSHEIELEREDAIFKAVEFALPGDIVVISGKGAENYIDQNGQKRFYQDKNVVLKIKNAKMANNNKKE